MFESSVKMIKKNICAPLSSIINASCINIPTQTGVEEEVAYERKEQELFMRTPPGLSACFDSNGPWNGCFSNATEIDSVVDINFSGLGGHFSPWS